MLITGCPFHRHAALLLGTRLTRETEEYGPVECDVMVWADITGHIPGYRAMLNDPGCGDEFEFRFVTAEFDGPVDDAPGPLTDAELARLETWLHTEGADAAYEAALEAVRGEFA